MLHRRRKKSPKREKNRTVILYVRPGDTLWKIAREYGTTVKAVAEENRIANPDMIFAGERLKITLPARDGREEIYTVKRGDTPISIAGKHGASRSPRSSIETDFGAARRYMRGKSS